MHCYSAEEGYNERFKMLSKQGIWFLITLTFSLAGQLLLKKGIMNVVAGRHLSISEYATNYLGRIICQPYVLLGLLMSGIGVLSWMYVLSRFPLSAALPMLGGMAYIALFIAGKVFLGEETNAINFLGILAIILGLYLLSIKTGL
jgi:multidrug transporter EmrE-like cation transporter